MEAFVVRGSDQKNQAFLKDSLMRVLWFTNTKANSDEYFNSELKGTGGWIKSLDKAIQEKTDLHVAFYHHPAISSFKYKNTTYHPIRYRDHYLEILKSRWFHHVLDQEDQDYYLRLIHKIKPDIIHIHGTENPFGCIAEKTSVPVVVSIQGNITAIRHKFFSGIEKKYLTVRRYDSLNVKSLLLPESFRGNYKRFIKMHRRELQNLQICRYIIGRTDWDRRISRVFAPNSIYFHNDEILRDVFYKAHWHKKNGKIILHSTLGNSFYKGFETICQALYELNQLNVEIEWRVAGISKDDLIVKIVRKVLKEKYPKQGLELLGRIVASDLVQRLLEANIYIMPSHIDNSPNSLCEAMLLGVPCIATYAGGTGSLLKDGEDGILIQDGDPWALAGAIMELLNNEDKAIQYGQNSRKRAVARHDKKKITNELMSIYNTIIKSSR